MISTRSIYHMLCGALLTVRLIVMRPLPKLPTFLRRSFSDFKAVWPANADCWIAVIAMRLRRLLLLMYKVSGISPCIVGDRISNMVIEVLNWTLSGDNGLDEEPEHRKHGQSSILELFNLQFCKCLGIISQSKWVEGTSWVKLIESFTEWASTNTDDLRSPDGKDALGMNEVRVAKIVKATFGEDLGPGLEPHCLTEFDTILCKDFGEHTA
ncbi:hypothetical protein RJ640_013596 [Escallonia rubra]|uniref:Uncharacterized protein n=1 Tax=Escallonia rubra TaxID=112253 RepID=A0AA88USA4_9ASTE|nr:hypothetical protein RJ640_013596 [Escallonia rubra]